MKFLPLVLLLASSLPCQQTASQPTTKVSRPNIILFMADDLGWGDVGYHGSEIRTPNIDQLARRGVKLNRYYAFPVCSPTRAAMMTGQSPLPMGITFPRNQALPRSLPILPQLFRRHGYQTWLLGKWHLGGFDVRDFPHNKGFDHFYGHAGATIDSITHIGLRGGLDWQRNGETVREKGHSTDLLTAEALRLLDKRGDRPFLLFMSYNAPHTPLVATEQDDVHDDIEDGNRRTYAAMVHGVDRSVGKVLAAIDQAGIRKHTLVLFLSDNGGAPRGGADNTPLRGAKGSLYEGGVRVPGVVQWSGRLAKATCKQQISCLDWLPTLLAAAGIQQPDMALDGQNMWSAIAKNRKVKRRDLVLGANTNRSIYRGKWKLIRNRGGGFGFRRGNRAPATQLFDIFADPFETKNLADQHANTVAQLTAALDAFEERSEVTAQAVRPTFRRGTFLGQRGRGRGGRLGGRYLEETQPPVAEAANGAKK